MTHGLVHTGAKQTGQGSEIDRILTVLMKRDKKDKGR